MHCTGWGPAGVPHSIRLWPYLCSVDYVCRVKLSVLFLLEYWCKKALTFNWVGNHNPWSVWQLARKLVQNGDNTVFVLSDLLSHKLYGLRFLSECCLNRSCGYFYLLSCSLSWRIMIVVFAALRLRVLQSRASFRGNAPRFQFTSLRMSQVCILHQGMEA